jgi:hypothetical protein
VRAGESFRLEYDFRAHFTRGQYHLECHVFHNPSQRYIGKLSPAAVLGISESRTYAGIADIELTCTPATLAPPSVHRARPAASQW